MGERDILPTMFIHTSLLSASLIGRQCVRCDAFLQLAAIYTTNERNKWRFFPWVFIAMNPSSKQTPACPISHWKREISKGIRLRKTVLHIEPLLPTRLFIWYVWHRSFLYQCFIYIYIKWYVFVNVTTKSAQHAHERMIVIIVEKSPNSSHIYDYGFMDNANRQAVKKWLNSQTSDASLTSWRQLFCKFIKWLPPWRKGRITCLKP